jgi:predicted  nucleic acid-binding Zn-ribbon protein
MVSRSDLLDALSEAKANNEDTTVLTSTNARLQDQLDTARQELVNLKDAMHKMVQAAELESEKKKLKDLEQAAKSERQKLDDTIAALNEKLRVLNSEKAALAAEIQVLIKTSV